MNHGHNGWLKGSVAGMILLSVILVAVILVKTGIIGGTANSGDQPAAGEQPTGQSTAVSAPARPVDGTADQKAGGTGDGDVTPADPSRPVCPVTRLAGKDFGCLGHPGEKPVDNNPDGPVVVAVWAWWCGPCRKELPHIAAFARTNPEYTVIGMHADREQAAGLDLLDNLGVDLPSLYDPDGTLAQLVGLPPVIPLLLVFDANGDFTGYTTATVDSPAAVAEAVDGIINR